MSPGGEGARARDPGVRRVRVLATEDLAGAVRQSLADLATAGEQLDAGIVPSAAMAALLEAVAGELRVAAAICGGYRSGPAR